MRFPKIFPCHGEKGKKRKPHSDFWKCSLLAELYFIEVEVSHTKKYMNKLLNSACENGLIAEFHQSIVSGSLNDEKQGGIDYVGMCTQAS